MVYASVASWLHRDASITAEFHRIELVDGKVLKLTAQVSFRISTFLLVNRNGRLAALSLQERMQRRKRDRAIRAHQPAASFC